MGDEAVALGALQAGISAAYSYPGTPATEIFEHVQRLCKKDTSLNVLCRWSINEKVALEEALGASLIGKRALVSMKHVGLNVAADPFMNASLTGTQGGLVICVADDPSMHSSQNEQDSRFYSWFSKILCLEPIDAQEAYDMTLLAFTLSEKWHLPIMIRLTTRVAHSRSNATLSEINHPQKRITLPASFKNWMLLPSNARPQFELLWSKQNDLTQFSNHFEKNVLNIRPNTQKAVITGGLAHQYFMECGGADDYSYLRVCSYPLPKQKILALLQNADELFVIEEGYPLIETLIYECLHEIPHRIIVHGRHDKTVPQTGELNTDLVKKSLGYPTPTTTPATNDKLVRPRPPQLCKGCPHTDTFKALNEALRGHEHERVVFSDIGCYSLGYYPPHEAIHSGVCMGASISMAKAAGENGLKYAIAVIGDSTFEHSGITPLLEGISRQVNFTVIILDNSLVAMTGGQERIMGAEQFVSFILGMGIDRDHLKIIHPIPKNHAENTRIIREECEYQGPSVILARRECLQK